MKRKLVTLGIAFLLCIGMVGAGFASWVVTNNVTETVDGQISVESVVDARLDLTVDVENGAENPLVIGGPTTQEGVEDPWLLFNGEVEDLKIEVNLKLNNYADLIAAKNAGEIDNIEIKVTLAEQTTDKLNTFAGKKYIKLPTSMAVDLKLTDFDENGEKTVEFLFAWGDAFKLEGETAGVNPWNYFNSFDSEAEATTGTTYADLAYNVLNELFTLNDANFTITVNGKATQA